MLDSFKVLIKVVHILDSEEAPVWELHYDVGTTVEMVCRVKRPPLQGKHYFYLVGTRVSNSMGQCNFSGQRDNETS